MVRTGVKAGKTTVYAVTEDGQNLICQVEVKENNILGSYCIMIWDTKNGE